MSFSQATRTDAFRGAVEVMKEFEVSTILSPDYVQDSLAYEDYQALLAEGNLEEIHPNAEEIYAFSNTFFTVVGPRKYGQGWIGGKFTVHPS